MEEETKKIQECERKGSMIATQMEELAQEIGRTDCLVSNLEEGLCRVLIKPVSVDEEKDIDLPIQPVLANEILTLRRRLCEDNNQLADIINRIDL